MPRLAHKKQTPFQLQATINSYSKSIAAIENQYGFVGLHHPKLSQKLPKDILYNYRHLHSMLKNAKQELDDRRRILTEYTKPKAIAAERKALELKFYDLLRMGYDQKAMEKMFVETRIFIQTYNV